MTVTDQHKTPDTADAGWYEDPNREHKLRYHDGMTWTPHVTHNGPTPCLGCSFTLGAN